jgi:ABC-type uncharacterized transport system fused permease/ATPase subunit
MREERSRLQAQLENLNRESLAKYEASQESRNPDGKIEELTQQLAELRADNTRLSALVEELERDRERDGEEKESKLAELQRQMAELQLEKDLLSREADKQAQRSNR